MIRLTARVFVCDEREMRSAIVTGASRGIG